MIRLKSSARCSLVLAGLAVACGGTQDVAALGSFAGCDSEYCIEGLAGNFHGTSGILPEDRFCRVAQVNQVFLDLDGGGQPGANGERNLVLGDFNTDPARSVLRPFDHGKIPRRTGLGSAQHRVCPPATRSSGRGCGTGDGCSRRS